MIRVAYVIPTLSVGGTETQLLYLVRGLVKDHDVTVICTRFDGALSGDVRRLGGFVKVLDVRSGWDFRMRSRVAMWLRAHRVDILHTFMFGFDLFPNLAAHDAGVPVVISSRRQLATWRKRRHLWIQRKANAYVDCIVANSQAAAEFSIEQEQADPALFRVIPNGIAADAFVSNIDPHQTRERHRIPYNTHVVGIVANFSPVKDHELFVAMAGELLERRPDVFFLMLGRGKRARAIESLIQRRGLADNFRRISTISEIADLYSVMSVSVLCSQVEGFPNVLIESMAAGVPVVAPNVGGINELVRHGETGLLAPSRTPTDLADAVCRILDNPAEAQHMSTAASAYVRAELSVDKMIDQYRRLYAELLTQKRGRGR